MAYRKNCKKFRGKKLQISGKIVRNVRSKQGGYSGLEPSKIELFRGITITGGIKLTSSEGQGRKAHCIARSGAASPAQRKVGWGVGGGGGWEGGKLSRLVKKKIEGNAAAPDWIRWGLGRL